MRTEQPIQFFEITGRLAVGRRETKYCRPGDVRFAPVLQPGVGDRKAPPSFEMIAILRRQRGERGNGPGDVTRKQFLDPEGVKRLRVTGPQLDDLLQGLDATGGVNVAFS